MPPEKTRGDSLREYLTGASSDGGVQTDPDASFGNYRSSTEAVSMAIVIADAIPGITVDYASGGNELGAGTLDAADAGTLRWKCYGGDYGPYVPITNGETKIVETDGSPGAFLRVTRTSADPLSGTATITLTKSINNVFAFDDVESAEAVAGDIEYRATIVKNENTHNVADFKRWIGELATSQVSDDGQLGASGAGTIVTTGTFVDWPDQGFCHIKNGAATREIVYYSERTLTTLTVPATGRELLGTTAGAGSATDTIHCVPGIAIAIDTDGVTSGGAAIQTIVNESTAPTSVSWNTGITEATGLSIGDVDAAEAVGIWYKRQIPADAVSTADAAIWIQDSFDAV